jgi:colanic acid/amylovoran biosynthesis protein
MHAAISTFKMRKPAISISYSVKYDGVIGTDLNMPELIIDKDVFESDGLAAAVDKKLDYVTENYDRLIKEISDTMHDIEKKAEDMIEDVARKIGGI